MPLKQRLQSCFTALRCTNQQGHYLYTTVVNVLLFTPSSLSSTTMSKASLLPSQPSPIHPTEAVVQLPLGIFNVAYTPLPLFLRSIPARLLSFYTQGLPGSAPFAFRICVQLLRMAPGNALFYMFCIFWESSKPAMNLYLSSLLFKEVSVLLNPSDYRYNYPFS